jgi:hypothetical protein
MSVLCALASAASAELGVSGRQPAAARRWLTSVSTAAS